MTPPIGVGEIGGLQCVFVQRSFCKIYRVTDEALIAETMVWPNFFLMNVFFALKGSKLFTIMQTITEHLTTD